MSELPNYVLEREFDTPREVVWRGWTEAALLSRWYGPNVETIVHKLDVKPGGLWLVEMRMGAMSMYQRVEYLEVDRPAKLVMIMSSADAGWNVTASPMMPDWPAQPAYHCDTGTCGTKNAHAACVGAASGDGG